jgi:hypothetical protein
MQAKAVQVDSQLWGGRPSLARQAFQAQHFLPGSWARGPSAIRQVPEATCRDVSAPSVAVSAR